MSDHSLIDGAEHQAVILLNIYSDSPTITAQERTSGSNDETTLSTVEDGGKRYDPSTGQLINGQCSWAFKNQ